MFSVEAEQFLNTLGYYLFEKEQYTYLDHFYKNTELVETILKPLVELYREYVIEAKINSNQSILSDYIGAENFEELVDIVNKVEYLTSQGLKYKLDKNEVCEEVKEYNRQLDRVKQIYKNIERYVANNINENKAKSL